MARKYKTRVKRSDITQKDIDEIEKLAGYCMTVREISLIKGISEPTLIKYFSDIMERGRSNVKHLVVDRLINNIKEGKEASIFFYLKTQFHWKEKHEVQHTGANGSALTPIINIRVVQPELPGIAVNGPKIQKR